VIDDARFRTNTDRVRNIDACDAIVADWIAQRTLAQNMAVFEAAEVTATPIFEIDQLLDDPHVQARGVFVEAPDDEAGSVLMHNVIPRLSDTPGRLRSPAPALGQHTRAVLESIGYDNVRLSALAADGVIKEG
jgi:crotonobetainyl-CoA:carnitine CoA-transferase CaiB-like acyl-CoA transferase